MYRSLILIDGLCRHQLDTDQSVSSGTSVTNTLFAISYKFISLKTILRCRYCYESCPPRTIRQITQRRGNDPVQNSDVAQDFVSLRSSLPRIHNGSTGWYV